MRQKRHREKYRARDKARAVALRSEVIAAYGSKCACCEESNPEFLTIDHTNRDGGAHRKATGGNGRGVFRDLKKRGWPKDGFALKCMNCNWATRWGKPCPHEYQKGLRLVQGCRR